VRDSDDQTPPRTFLLESALAAVLILGPAICLGLALDQRGGSIAEWVSALATTFAFAAAFYAARYTRDLLSVERGRDEDRELREKMEQASRVVLWPVGHLIGHITPETENKPPAEQIFTITRQAVRYVNTSALPVFQVGLTGHIHAMHPETGEKRSAPVKAKVAQTLMPTAEPHEAYSQFFAKAEPGLAIWPDTNPVVDLDLRLQFRDSFGLMWERHLDGTLELIRDPGRPTIVLSTSHTFPKPSRRARSGGGREA